MYLWSSQVLKGFRSDIGLNVSDFGNTSTTTNGTHAVGRGEFLHTGRKE
jgi:hypothetical protein